MNKITEWSWEKPTEPGLYLACRGDVETKANISFLNVISIDGQLIDSSDNFPVEYFDDSIKFARLLVGAEVGE